MTENNANMKSEDLGQSVSNNHNNNSNNGTNRGHGRLDVRCIVCSRDAGAIIGKKGANIQSLRQKHRVIIQVPDCDGPERILAIQGDYEACLAAIMDILPTLRDNQRVQSDQSEIRLLTHQSQAGAVIGKGGDRVRELRTKHNVGMKVFVQCLPFSTERVVALRGRAEDIDSCLREIFGILEQTPPRGQMCFYDPYNFDENLASEYGGFTEGSHGIMMNNNPPMGGMSNAPPPPPPAGYRPGPHDPMGYPGPSYNNNNSYPPGSNDPYNQGLSHPPPPPGGPRPLILGNEGNYNAPQHQTNQVTIPNHLASCIIGPRGTKIAQIRQTSGAMIYIDDPAPGSNDRIITIQGTPNQISQAQYLLQMAVKESGLWTGN